MLEGWQRGLREGGDRRSREEGRKYGVATGHTVAVLAVTSSPSGLTERMLPVHWPLSVTKRNKNCWTLVAHLVNLPNVTLHKCTYLETLAFTLRK